MSQEEEVVRTLTSTIFVSALKPKPTVEDEAVVRHLRLTASACIARDYKYTRCSSVKQTRSARISNLVAEDGFDPFLTAAEMARYTLTSITAKCDAHTREKYCYRMNPATAFHAEHYVNKCCAHCLPGSPKPHDSVEIRMYTSYRLREICIEHEESGSGYGGIVFYAKKCTPRLLDATMHSSNGFCTHGMGAMSTRDHYDAVFSYSHPMMLFPLGPSFIVRGCKNMPKSPIGDIKSMLDRRDVEAYRTTMCKRRDFYLADIHLPELGMVVSPLAYCIIKEIKFPDPYLVLSTSDFIIKTTSNHTDSKAPWAACPTSAFEAAVQYKSKYWLPIICACDVEFGNTAERPLEYLPMVLTIQDMVTILLNDRFAVAYAAMGEREEWPTWFKICHKLLVKHFNDSKRLQF